MVKNWARRTPGDFRFTAKFPKIITHDKKFKNVQKDLELFYKRMEPLKEKLLALLIQSPPSYKLTSNDQKPNSKGKQTTLSDFGS